MGRLGILAGSLAVALAIPLFVDSFYYLRLFNVSLVFALLAVSLNIMLGYTGLVALGHAGFFGIGAYTAALITMGGSGAMFWPGFLAAGLVTGLFGLAIGIPTLRLKGHYLALATLGFGEIMRHIFFNWREVTHGMDGISGIPAPSFGPAFAFVTDTRFYYLALAVLLVVLFFNWRIDRSKYGRMLGAIRDAELAAGTAGVDVPRLKVMAFFISAVIAGFAGALYAHLVTYISPDVFIFDVTAQILSMVLIGGMGTVVGPVLGAVTLTFLPELLRISEAYYQLIYGAGIALMVIFLPMGLLGLLHGRYLLFFGPRRVETEAPEPEPEQGSGIDTAASAALKPVEDGGDSAAAALQVENLTCRFGGLVAVDDLSLRVERGVVHAIIGPNGSGKSTFINLATGIYTPNAGTISCMGERVSGRRPWQVCNVGLTRTFQNLRLFNSMSLLDNVMVATRTETVAGWGGVLLGTSSARQEERELRERAEQALRFVGLWHLRDQYVRVLPHEQQRLVEIARALARRPRLIMLDEPAAGMNPTEVERLIACINRMRDLGITVVLIEHNMPLVMRIADRITVLNFGRKIADGTPAEIRENPEVIQAYLGQRLSKRLSGDAVA